MEKKPCHLPLYLRNITPKNILILKVIYYIRRYFMFKSALVQYYAVPEQIISTSWTSGNNSRLVSLTDMSIFQLLPLCIWQVLILLCRLCFGFTLSVISLKYYLPDTGSETSLKTSPSCPITSKQIGRSSPERAITKCGSLSARERVISTVHLWVCRKEHIVKEIWWNIAARNCISIHQVIYLLHPKSR